MRRRGSILALVLAGGEGGRLSPLTDERAKPALPFGGTYRLIDFPLSNCHHSRMSDVWVLQQYEAHSLSEYLANGRPWDLDRTFGGLRVVQPYLGDEESGWYEGNADAIHRNREAIADFDPKIVLVLSADAVYTLDYDAVVVRHVERGAEVTMVTSRVPRDEAGRYGIVEADADGQVERFEYKPERPRSDVVTAEVFVYDAAVLLDTLADVSASDDDAADFGHALLPALVDRGRAYADELPGYWRDVGTVDSYWAAHMDLLGPDGPPLDDPGWPILTRPQIRRPAHVAAGARVEDSLISPACRVDGEVVRSVLGPGVVVERGARVEDAVVLPDAVLATGASVRCAVVDEGARVPEGEHGERGEIAVVSGADAPPD